MLTSPSGVPLHWIPKGVLLTEWLAFSELRKFEVGRESMGGSATVIAVSDTECEFRFNHYWSASDVGWPKELLLAGSLRVAPDSALRVRLWTTPAVRILGLVVVGAPTLVCVGMLLRGALTGNWTGVGPWLVGACVAGWLVASSLKGAKRFGEDAVKVAKGLGVSSREHR